MERDLIKVFVYGTLKVGGVLSYQVSDFLIDTKAATTTGKMFNVRGSYPAVIFDNTAGPIIGEIHTYEKPNYVLRVLDSIEGCNGNTHPNNLYNRKTITVKDTSGEEHECFAYEFARNVDTFEHIEEGLWPV
jgi:gamma-glutamylcyclotransferase (GGCT)/AIG2-like uncharacterized protein YtfP